MQLSSVHGSPSSQTTPFGASQTGAGSVVDVVEVVVAGNDDDVVGSDVVLTVEGVVDELVDVEDGGALVVGVGAGGVALVGFGVDVVGEVELVDVVVVGGVVEVVDGVEVVVVVGFVVEVLDEVEDDVELLVEVVVGFDVDVVDEV